MLFVSAENVDRFAKAIASEADLVCIDLEDAVHPDLKTIARSNAIAWIENIQSSSDFKAKIALRMNGIKTIDGLEDVLAIKESNVKLDWLLLPKTENESEVQCVCEWIGDKFSHLSALLETPLGIQNSAAIAKSSSQLGALMLGGADLSVELNSQFNWDALLLARGQIVMSAKAAKKQAWDVPHVDLSNLDELAKETRMALSLGFDCNTAIHPKQVSIIHNAHKPTAEQLAWAQLLVEAVPGGQGSGAFLYRGRMVDAPLLQKARRIVDIASRTY